MKQEAKKKMKVPEMRAALKELGLDIKGSKAELQDRLANANAIAKFENAENLDDAIELSDDDDAAGTSSHDHDPYANHDASIPSKKRPRQGCDCYTCRGTVFRVDHRTGITAAATSICATIRLGCSLSRDDLKVFTREVELGNFINGAVYNPRRCPAVQIATSHPETSINLYSCEGGPAKLVCLGARTKDQAMRALRRISRQVQISCAPYAEFKSFTVANYIMSGDLKFQVRLSELLVTLNTDAEQNQRDNSANYEPELSPKLAYHMQDPVDIKLDIFHTGKMNVLRCLGREDLIKALDFLWPMLQQHRIFDEPAPQPVIVQPAPAPVEVKQEIQAPRQPQIALPMPTGPHVASTPSYAGPSPAFYAGPSPAYAGPSPATCAALGIGSGTPINEGDQTTMMDDFDQLLDGLE